MITRSMSSARDELRQLAHLAEHGELVEVVAALAWVLVDEADEVDAVLRMLQQLVRDALPDVPGADDDGVLDVRVEVATDAARDTARERDEDDRRSPRRRRSFGTVGCASPVSQVIVKNTQVPTVSMLKSAEQVVDGRVVGAGLVAVVEAVDTCECEPERQREEERRDTRRGAERCRTAACDRTSSVSWASRKASDEADRRRRPRAPA